MKIILKRPGFAAFILSLVAALFWFASAGAVEPAAPLRALGRMPIKEITVFKDGHAFVAQEGSLPVDAAGDVSMDALPAPVIGTFWPYSKDKNAKLAAVVASQRRVSVEHTALSIPELLAANIGAKVIVTESPTNHYSATIVGMPGRDSEELAATGLPGAPEKLPELGSIILLKTSEGVRAIDISRIQDVTFKDKNKSVASREEFRNLLKLKLDWGKTRPAARAEVGMLYLQKGFRWIPSYKITLDGAGNAVVKLQATLINELADLEDASVNLVVGVPTFAFKDALDPISLQQAAAQLSQYFQANPQGAFQNSALGNNFNNSIMSQQVQYSRPAESPNGAADGSDAGADMGDATRNEDLFVFNAGHITLKKGERMVLALAEYSIPYHDVFTLELPFAPPGEMNRNLNDSQQREMARLLNSPKVMHKLRLTNKSHYPLTTAPALILREGRVLSQGMMTYTAVGAASDITVTTAVDISAKKSDNETGRAQNAITYNGSHFSRIDLAGKIMLTNHRAQAAELEVTRYVLGSAESAGQDGKVEKINSFEDADYGATHPNWWGWYSWPHWWSEINGIGRVTWKLKLDAGQHADLDYKWSYFGN